MKLEHILKDIEKNKRVYSRGNRDYRTHNKC